MLFQTGLFRVATCVQQLLQEDWCDYIPDNEAWLQADELAREAPQAANAHRELYRAAFKLSQTARVKANNAWAVAEKHQIAVANVNTSSTTLVELEKLARVAEESKGSADQAGQLLTRLKQLADKLYCGPICRFFQGIVFIVDSIVSLVIGIIQFVVNLVWTIIWTFIRIVFYIITIGHVW